MRTLKLFEPLLMEIHIIFGFFSLLFILLILVFRKGQKTHFQFGRLYMISLFVVSTTSILLSLIKIQYRFYPTGQLFGSLSLFQMFLIFSALLAMLQVRLGTVLFSEYENKNLLKRHRVLSSALLLPFLLLAIISIFSNLYSLFILCVANFLIIIPNISIINTALTHFTETKVILTKEDRLVFHIKSTLQSVVILISGFFGGGGSFRYFNNRHVQENIIYIIAVIVICAVLLQLYFQKKYVNFKRGQSESLK